MSKNLGILGVVVIVFAIGLVFVTQQTKAGKNDTIRSEAAASSTGTVRPDELLLVGTVVTEAYAGGNGNGSYDSDWFEVTNAGSTPLNITGWKWDDSSNSFATAIALRGVTTIPAGKSAIFMESDVAGATDAAKIAAFCSAWFGTATPPPGFLIGTYGGAGIGLGNGGDAVNLFDAAGVPITSVTIGSATAAFTFDNAAGLTTVTALSVAGTNGARFASGETGSPGTIVNLPTSVDLSTYVRIGRHDLPEPTRTTPPPNSLLAQEVSGVTYNWDTNTLFVVGDAGSSVVQVSKTGQLIDSMTLATGSSPQGSEFYDPEGITYIGGGKFVITEERDRRVVQFTYAAGTTLTRAAAQTVGLGTFVQNIGLEGITYDPQTSGFILAKESAPLGIFQTGIDFAAGTATSGSPTTVNSTNLFDPALLGMIDIADVFAFSTIPSFTGANRSRLLVLSHESGKIVNVDRSGGISSTLTIVSDPGNPLSVAAQQHEGLTMDFQGNLYTVSENGGGDFDHPQLWVYRPSTGVNLPPTAIVLNNQVNTIVENTSTATRIKVADIAITDDGQGTNSLSVSGADAAFFEVESSGLYIKAGTVLDFETKSSYAVTVRVDDTTVGATPDASVNFALTVADVINENPVPSIIVSEVAAFSSGNSPVGADWFEITNTGVAPVTLTGWRVDDSSASFATALPLNGVTSIAPGESVIFIETANIATTSTTFRNVWFGASPPASLQIGSYTGGGIGLSTGGDEVNLYNSGGVLQAKVIFGASPAAPTFATFNNAAGLNNATISQLSAVGVNGAITAANPLANTVEIGSPGTTGKLFISEVAPWSSGNSPVAADWFEVTNVTAFPIDITGWRVDDSSGSFLAALPLTGITTINAGESVIFFESANPSTTAGTFRTTWFGANPPASLRFGSYTGGGIGLSTGGDAVNLYNSTGVLQASVLFGASPAGPVFSTFDNAAGLNNVTISQLSAVGVNGAFLAAIPVAGATEIGSPGRIFATGPAPTPTPRPLTANNDNYTTPFGTTLAVAAAQGVLANDIGSPLNVIDSTNPAGGQLTMNADSSFNFVPANGFYGQTTFSYTISDVAQTFRMNNPPLGVFGGVSVGGDAFGSSIAAVPGSTDEYWGVTDRGPNVDNLNNATKVEPIPTFNPAIGRFKLINGSAVLQGTAITLKGPNNEPYNGQVSTEASTGEIITDINGNILPPSPFGYDPEGLVALPDGTFWVSDEYGPYITKFDATGRQIQRLSPFNGSLPRELSKRRPNRGMEGLTVTPDGTRLVGMMQSPLINDITQAQTNTTTVLRIVVYTIANGQLREYLYLLDNPATNAGAVSEITALTNTTFLVEERDGLFPPAGFKRIFQIDITGATDVGPLAAVPGATYDTAKGLLIGTNTLERHVVAQNTATARTTLAAAGITPVSKTLKLDLVAMVQALSPTSRIFAHDKVEGLVILDGGNKLVISNDSDFGIVGITNTTPPFQLQPKTVAARGGQVDFGEFLVLDVTKPIQTSTGTVTITVGPPPTAIAFSSATYKDDESQSAVVTLTRTGVTTGISTATISTVAGGTATGGATCTGAADYQTTTQTVTFPAGSTAPQTVSIPLCRDTLLDTNETFNVTLSNPNAGTGIGAQGTAVVTINDTANQFLNADPISIIGGAAASAYPAPIVVSGATTNVFRMRVTLYDFYHALPDNVEVLLVGPNGGKYVLMGDVGGPAPIVDGANVTLTLGDFYAGLLSDGGPLTTGGFKPTTCGTTPMTAFPAPAPVLPYAEPGCTTIRPNAQTLYGNFGQATANGTWNLFIRDDNGAARTEAPEVVLGEVSGRVLTADGRGLRNAQVTITDSMGNQRTATTGSFGHYRFEDVEVGSSYVVSVSIRRYRFTSRVVNVTDSLTNVDFFGLE